MARNDQMEKGENYDAFVEAYNNFDNRPLSGENLKKFYVDDFTKQTVGAIVNTIRITERFKKMLIIGHRGCGKSTILNKVGQELKEDYHIVSFSAADFINMMDVEAVDILLTTYMRVLESVERDGKFRPLFDKFDELIKLFKKEINLEGGGFKLLGLLSFKFKVEPESRAAIRKKMVDQVRELQGSLSEACLRIQEEKNKDVLIIIDDLDKLDTEAAERIFFNNVFMLTATDSKIVYTFPLDTYYCDAFIRIRDIYADHFIPLVNLSTAESEPLASSRQSLIKLILKRINEKLITEDARKYIIEMSGGLLRDLVKFAQDACNLAMVRQSPVIDREIAENAVNKHINDYYRVLDFPEYADKIRRVAEIRQKIDNKTLVYLLRYLFVLEYRHRNKLWYDAHPCMKKALEIEGKPEIIMA